MLQTILTSRVAVLGAGAACLLAANVQSGSVIENYYKDQVNLVYAVSQSALAEACSAEAGVQTKVTMSIYPV